MGVRHLYQLIFLCLTGLLVQSSGFAQESAPYQTRLSRQQDLIVGEWVELEFYAEITEANWAGYSETPYPNLKAIRPNFIPGTESKGIAWGEGDLSRSINPVRASNDLAAPLVMNKHELIYSKKFQIQSKKAKVTGLLTGTYQTGFADSLETLNFSLPVSMELEARDSTVKRWLMASDKINNVLAVVVIIFLGLIIYSVVTQRKLKKLTQLANELKEAKNS